MKKLSLILLTILSMNMCATPPNGQKILIETSLGNIKVVLYDETPLHRDNFIKQIESEYYNDLTFHRVIKDFMIQAGDSKSTGDSTIKKFDQENVIQSEFRTPQYFHQAGALAAARWGDEENPQKLSDAFQFYIVTGEVIHQHGIKAIEKQRIERLKQTIYNSLQSSSIDTIKAMYKEGNRAGIAEFRADILEQAEKETLEREHEVLFTDEQKEIYSTIGGTPHLDGEYTVFGKVYEGLDIVKKIEVVDTNINDKPLTAVVIKKISLIN